MFYLLTYLLYLSPDDNPLADWQISHGGSTSRPRPSPGNSNADRTSKVLVLSKWPQITSRSVYKRAGHGRAGQCTAAVQAVPHRFIQHIVQLIHHGAACDSVVKTSTMNFHFQRASMS